MHHTLRTSTLMMAAAAALALSACSRSDDRSAGEKLDATIAKTEQAATDAKATMQQEAAEVKTEASAAADRAKAAVADAGAKTGAAIEQMADKVGDKVSDAGITAGVNAELAKDSALSALRIDVDTANGHVSLRGTAPSTLARDRATTLAKSVKGVNSVDNQLVVRG
jgi:osmotically-inducible protein OsmY